MLTIRFCNFSVQFAPPNRKLFVPSSTNSSPQIPNYFVDKLGFSQQQAHSISTKLRYKVDDARFPKFSDNANSVIHFFKQHGFDDVHIKKVVSYYPRLLTAKVDKTLKPKFILLQDHGFSESAIVSIIFADPSILQLRLDTIIRDLRTILGATDNIIKFFNTKQANIRIKQSALENLNSNIALLNKEYGLDINLIRSAIVKRPSTYLSDTDVFQKIVARVEKEVGIPRNSRMFTYGIQLLHCSSKESMESKCEVFKSCGWTEYDVSVLMRRHPLVFGLSEENIRKKLVFFMTELGYKTDFLVAQPALLGYSLEKRLVPRHRVLVVLKERGLLDYSLANAACRSEKHFLKIFIEPFKKDAPGLLELYESSKVYSNTDAISRHQQRQPLS